MCICYFFLSETLQGCSKGRPVIYERIPKVIPSDTSEELRENAAMNSNETNMPKPQKSPLANRVEQGEAVDAKLIKTGQVQMMGDFHVERIPVAGTRTEPQKSCLRDPRAKKGYTPGNRIRSSGKQQATDSRNIVTAQDCKVQ